MTAPDLVRTGVQPLDERVGGLEAGGIYLVVGAPGPAKLVAALHFLHEGVQRGERCLLVTNADPQSLLEAARAWGLPLDAAWNEGSLQILGFRDDFELRAIRSIEPEEVLEELATLVEGTPSRVAVDPGSMFLTGGAKTLLGSAFVTWAKTHPATVFATFSVDGDATSLPSTADWLVNSTTALLVVERRSDGLFQVTFSTAVPEVGDPEETVSLELKPGSGLIAPEHYLARRGADRGDLDRDRLLLVSLGDSHSSDLETWAGRAFTTDVVTEPFDAVAKAQGGSSHGCVLIHAPRRRVREAVQACRALRPLTRAAIVFASDDAIRSTDRIHILEAGADDCLTGGLDFRELRLRIEQAAASGANKVRSDDDSSAAPNLMPVEADGGRVSIDILGRQVALRSDDPALTFFCLLTVTPEGLSAVAMEGELAELVRSEEGDLVARDADRCLVLLQGVREAQIGAFVDRLHTQVRSGNGTPAKHRVEVLSHPAESEGIRALLGSVSGEAN